MDRGRWWAGLGVVLAVVLAAGCVALSAGSTNGPAAGDPPAAPQPWLPLPPGPEPGPPGPTPAPTSDLPECTAGDLQAQLVDDGAAAGTRCALVLLHNVSGESCQLPGDPDLVGLTKGSSQSFGSVPAFLSAGATGGFSVARSSTPGCGGWDARPPDPVVLRLPDGEPLTLAGLLQPGCFVGTSPFALVRRDPTESPGGWGFAQQPTPSPAPPSGLDSLGVSMSAGPQRPGSIYDYTVTLTDRGGGPVSLEPCPTYAERDKADPGPDQRYTLNCNGIEMILPGTSVTFALRYAVPDGLRRNEMMMWWLDGRPEVAAWAPVTVG